MREAGVKCRCMGRRSRERIRGKQEEPDKETRGQVRGMASTGSGWARKLGKRRAGSWTRMWAPGGWTAPGWEEQQEGGKRQGLDTGRIVAKIGGSR